MTGYFRPGSHGRLLAELKSWELPEDDGRFHPVRWIVARLEEGCFIVAIGNGMGDYAYSPSGWRELRREVLERDQNRCVYCGDPATCVDHVLPKAWGGLTVERNLVAACKPCNSRKGDRL